MAQLNTHTIFNIRQGFENTKIIGNILILGTFETGNTNISIDIMI